MAAMVPLGVLAFLDQMGFLAYLGCLYVPTQIWRFAVTKPGFAFHAVVGKVTPKYLGRTLITLFISVVRAQYHFLTEIPL